MISKRFGVILLLLLTAVVTLAVFLVPRFPQSLAYHNFSDHRSWLGISNFGNVASNLPFTFFGAWGLLFLASAYSKKSFLDPRERWPYTILFIGMFLTAFGSAYYHLAPDNNRLVWDRLPMTIVFMSLVAAMIAERIDLRASLYLLFPLLCLGVASVIQWHYSELRGEGDLRIYAAVQLYSVMALLLLLLLPPRYTRTSDLIWVAAFYVLAKILETADRQVFEAGHFVSGHTLKHLAASLSGYWILHMLKYRVPIALPVAPKP